MNLDQFAPVVWLGVAVLLLTLQAALFWWLLTPESRQYSVRYFWHLPASLRRFLWRHQTGFVRRLFAVVALGLNSFLIAFVVWQLIGPISTTLPPTIVSAPVVETALTEIARDAERHHGATLKEIDKVRGALETWRPAPGPAIPSDDAAVSVGFSDFGLLALYFLGFLFGVWLFASGSFSGSKSRKEQKDSKEEPASPPSSDPSPAAARAEEPRTSSLRKWVGAGTMLVAGFLILRSPITFSIIKDFKFSIFEIKVHVGGGESPPPPELGIHISLSRGQPGIELDCGDRRGPYGIESFPDGRATFEGATREQIEARDMQLKRILDAIGDREPMARLIGVILIGSADKRPLRRNLLADYGSNAGLAQARAAWLAEHLAEHVAKDTRLKPLAEALRSRAFFSIQAGPTLGRADSPSDLTARDRAVRMCMIWG